jgi:hypothetical protein
MAMTPSKPVFKPAANPWVGMGIFSKHATGRKGGTGKKGGKKGGGS